VKREPISKEPSGRYMVVLDVAAQGDRRRQLRRRFDTYRDARAWLTETRSLIGTGSFVQPRKLTFAMWVEQWLPVLKTQVRPATYHSYERNLRLHVLPDLGGRRLQQLKPADLSALYARLLISGRKDHLAGGALSHRSVAYIATIVGKCLEAAVRGELLQSNAGRRAEVPRAEATARKHEQLETWSRDELARFLRLAVGERNYTAWLLLATTGLRRGEALGLSWSTLDLEKGRVSVRRTLVDVVRGRPVWSDPKTMRGRRAITLDAATVAAMRAVRQEQLQERLLLGSEYCDDFDLVFAWQDGSPVHPDRFSRSFRRLQAKHGLRPLSLHGLRHTWATLALQVGVHPKVVQERLGHSSIAVTMDIYSHVLPSMESDAAELVAALILGSHPPS
jgi:integrase